MYLRDLKETDAEIMLEWMHDQNVVEKMAADFMHMTIDDCVRFIQNSNSNETLNVNRAICSDEDEYLGTISLKNISKEDLNAEYAIVLSRKAIGKGISSLATIEILKIAFYDLHLHKVYLYVKESNKRAIRFYEKFGFRREGVFLEHIREKDGTYENLVWMSILNREFEIMQNKEKYDE